MKNLKVAYTSLKDNMQVVFFLQLGSTEKQLQTTYNEVDTMKQGILEAKATQDGLRAKLYIAKEETQNSCARMKALRNSSVEF